MARETVSGATMRTLPKTHEEAPVEGFLKGVVNELNKFGAHQYNFLMNDRDGREFKVLSSGTAKYFAKNVAMALGLEPVNAAFAGQVEAAKKVLHKWVIFTFDGSYVNKTKQTVTKYIVETDSDIKPGDKAPVTESFGADVPF